MLKIKPLICSVFKTYLYLFTLISLPIVFAESIKTDAAIIITDIKIEVKVIYADTKDSWLYEFANQYHIKTKDSVIKNLLPMDIGDSVTQEQVIEAERLLRKKGYLRDAELTLNAQGILNVVVVDNWTLFPTVNFGRKGGENSSALGIRDSNLLGLGISTTLKYQSDHEKSGYRFRISSPINWIDFSTVHLILENYDIGSIKHIVYQKPFYTRTSKNMFYSLFNQSDIDNTYFQNDVELGTARTKTTSMAYTYGWHNIEINDKSFRTLVGVSSFRRELISYSDASLAKLFNIRDKSYIWWGTELFQSQFKVLRNIHLMTNKEDINLGLQSQFKVGLGNISFVESDQNIAPELLPTYYLNHSESRSMMLKLSYEASLGQRINDTLILHKLTLDAEKYDTEALGSYYSGSYKLEFFQPINDKYTLFSGNRFSYVNDYRDTPHSLGAEDGLRGYPLQYQYGQKIWLSSFELRYYSDVELWETFGFAWVAFYDVGRAWDNISTKNTETGMLSSVGIGLRVFPIITSGNNVIHIDFAKPNSDNADIGKWQWRLQIKSRF